MATKGYQGDSPADRATNIMDKFIRKQNRKNALQEKQPLRRKDPDIPIHLWPLKDQIEYWDNMSDAERFDRKYSYPNWYDEVLKCSGLYHITFTDCVSSKRNRLREIFASKVTPREAVDILRKEKII